MNQNVNSNVNSPTSQPSGSTLADAIKLLPAGLNPLAFRQINQNVWWFEIGPKEVPLEIEGLGVGSTNYQSWTVNTLNKKAKMVNDLGRFNQMVEPSISFDNEEPIIIWKINYYEAPGLKFTEYFDRKSGELTYSVEDYGNSLQLNQGAKNYKITYNPVANCETDKNMEVKGLLINGKSVDFPKSITLPCVMNSFFGISSYSDFLYAGVNPQSLEIGINNLKQPTSPLSISIPLPDFDLAKIKFIGFK